MKVEKDLFVQNTFVMFYEGLLFINISCDD